MNLFEFLDRLLACSHPLILHDPNDEYPFFRGTCFTVRYHGRFFVLTALHCFTELKVKSVRIDCGGEENSYFPLKKWWCPENVDLPESDLLDIAIFEVDTSKMTDSEINRVPRLELAEGFPGVSQLASKCDLFVEGYPYEKAEYDIESRRTIRPSCKLVAVCEGATGTAGV